MSIGTGISRYPSANECPGAAANSSSGMEIEIFWRISSEFGAEERYWRRVYRSEEIGGDRGVWRGGEAVVGGGYGEKIEGCRDSEVGEDRRVVGSGDRGGCEEVVGEEKAGSGGCGERVGGECRDSEAGVASEIVEQLGEVVEKSSGEELPGRSWSEPGEGVVSVSAGKLVCRSGQPSLGGRRPELLLYDSLEKCIRPRSFRGGVEVVPGGSRRCGCRPQAARARDTDPRISEGF